MTLIKQPIQFQQTITMHVLIYNWKLFASNYDVYAGTICANTNK